MNDRLADLKKGAGSAAVADPKEVSIDIEEQDDSKEKLKSFFEQVNLIKGDIDAVKSACKEMDTLTEAALLTGNEKSGASAKDRITTLLNATNKRVAHAKALLQTLRDETKALKADTKRAKPAEIRVRENLQNTLTRTFVDIAKEYQNKQNRYKTQIRGKAERAIKAVKPTATDEEMQQVFAQEDGVKRVLEAAVLQQSGDPVEVANVLAEVQDTYEDVRRLEASILELHKMFMDLAVLIERQGEMLDQIEYQVKTAGDYVRQGNESITNAIQKAKVIRKRQCCMIGIILGVIAVIIVIIIFMKS